jgi:RHS repeat-associated protein
VTELLNQIGSTTISDFSGIAYDGVGNRNSVTANIPGMTSLSGTTGYSYDSKDQITQETSTRNGGFTDNFGYDSAGNPTSFKGITKSYNSNNQQTGTGFSHDGNGNPTNYGGTTLTFDPENRMIAYGSVLTAGYNGDGLRAWKDNATSRTYFLFDGIVPLVEMNSSGSVIATNSFGASGLVSRREGGTSVFYSFDSEGNVSQRTDVNGSVLLQHAFGAHGDSLGGAPSDPFGYKAQYGYYTDSETGLQLLTFRYYDHATGRFVTRDPISYAGGVNLYSYVTNNPLRFADSLGLDGDWLPDWMGFNRSSENGIWWSDFWQAYHDISLQAALDRGDWVETSPGHYMPLPMIGCGVTFVSPPGFLGQEAGPAIRVPKPPASPTEPPGPDWGWRGKNPTPGSEEGSWHNPVEDQSLHPHLGGSSHGPHWDWHDSNGNGWRIYPGGGLEAK